MPQTKEVETESPRLTEAVTFACEEIVRKTIDRIAAAEDRKPGSVARILVKEALRARGELPDAA